jgi:VanZ family protein
LINPNAATQKLLKIGFWIPLVICTWLALAPEPPEIPVFKVSDVLQHAFAFTYLSFALMLAYERRSPLQTLLLLLLYGLAIELVQSLEVERNAELKDLGVDLVGICLGVWLARTLADQVRELVLRLLSGLIRK